VGVAQKVSAFRFSLSAFWHRIVAVAAPRMAAANPFRRQRAAGQRAVFTHRFQCKLRTGRREAAAAGGAEQKNLRRRNRPAIKANRENQNVLERVHSLVFEQSRAVERGEKILFDFGKIFLGDGIPRDQNQFHRPREFMLMQPETFAEQPPGAAAGRRIADFFAGDDAELGRGTVGQMVPVGDEAAQHEAFTALADAREIAALREPRRTAQAQAFRRGIHKIKPA